MNENELSERELEILKLMAEEALWYKEIGERLHLSPHTVRYHIASIYRKLGVHSRIEAAVWAIRNGVAEIERVE